MKYGILGHDRELKVATIFPMRRELKVSGLCDPLPER